MHLRQQIKSVYFFLIICLFLPFLAFTQQNINDIKVVVTFESAPDIYTVSKAPLKYNKTFALSFQVDNGSVDLYNKVFPHINNLKYTDGCGNDIPFTASSSFYVFHGEGENGPDIHDQLDPSFDPAYLTWESIKELYNKNYGMYNYGINTNASTISSFMNYSIKRNRSFVRRKMFGTIGGAYASKVFACPQQKVEWTESAFDNDYDLVLNNQDGGPIGLFGGDVNGAFSWMDQQYFKRREAHRSIPVLEYVDSLNTKSVDGGNYWGSLYSALLPDEDDGESHYPVESFTTDFSIIASVYGKGAADNIIVASAEEIYDYLNIRDALTVEKNLNNNVLEITFSGNVPTDLRFYALSLVVESDKAINSIEVNEASNSSINKITGLINFSWNDRLIEDPIVLAEDYTSIAELSQDQYDAWIAMDYVYTLPLDTAKVELAQRLCNIPGTTYDDGFCEMTIDTITKITGDTIICLGESTILSANSIMEFYTWSTGENTQTIEVSPTENTEYWVKGTLNDIQTKDSITVIVNPVPTILSHSLSDINHLPGINDTLWVSVQTDTLSFLWNTGDVDSSLVVDPEFTTEYYVDVISDSGCSTRQVFNVNVANTFDFTFDSVCFGDTTHLINISTYPDSVIRVLWDLNSDGVFDDAIGDTVDYKFSEAGNHLVGMKSVLYPAGIELTFNPVAVGDNPNPDFDVSNVCYPYSSNFNDASTLIVGELTEWYWEFGDGGTDNLADVSHTYSQIGTYDIKLIVSSNIGCTDSITKPTTIFKASDFELLDADGNILSGNDTTFISSGESLYVTISNANSYDSIIWDNKVKSTEYYVVNAGEYSVEAYDGPCPSSSSAYMAFSGGGGSATNKIMSLFTPNGDGYNDNWVVNDPDITAPFKVNVYNRYGNLVYESADYQNDWRGTFNNTSLPQATYYYVIEDALGVIFKGPVTILR